MSIYKGNNLIAGALPNAANNTLSNVASIAPNSAVLTTLNSAMDNKEDVFDQVLSPLAITYTNGLFNPLTSTLSSDGLLSGTNDWNSVDISSSSINELTDYYKIVFLINRSATIGSAVQVFCLEDVNSEIFYLEVDGSALYVSDSNTQYESVSLPTDQFVTVEIEHQANSSDISLSCNGTTLSSITIRALTSDDISLISFAPVDNDVVLDISNKTYFMTVPNGVHNTFLSRNLTTDGLNVVYDNQANVINNQTLAANASKQIDLSNYLPNDGATYLVLVSAECRSGTTSGNNLNLQFNTDLIAAYCVIAANITRTSSYVRGGSTVWMPVGAERYINIRNGNNLTNNASITNVYASLRGYIRLTS